MALIDTISLGGGIVYLKEDYSSGSFIDLGFCPSFSVNLGILEDHRSRYFADSSGNIFKLPTTESTYSQFIANGKFVCESVDRKMMQSIWFRGTSTSDGTTMLGDFSAAPIIRALKIITYNVTGPDYCLILPAVSVIPTGDFNLISTDSWRSVSFDFTVLYSETTDTFPILRVQEEGETLTDFCI